MCLATFATFIPNFLFPVILYLVKYAQDACRPSKHKIFVHQALSKSSREIPMLVHR